MPRAALDAIGVRYEMVETDENGDVEDNACVVAEAVRRRADELVLLVSASKSGGEVALALGRELAPEETGHVLAWLSVGGVVRGTPAADFAFRFQVCLYTRVSLALDGRSTVGLASLRRSRRAPVFDTLDFPADPLLLALVPVPVSGSEDQGSKTLYRVLRADGPSDGLVLLGDQLLPGGTTLLAPGYDHFARHPEQGLLVQALMRTAVELASSP